VRQAESCIQTPSRIRRAYRIDIHEFMGFMGIGRPEEFPHRHPRACARLVDYLEAAGHGGETTGALFRLVMNNVGGSIKEAMTADGIYGEALFVTCVSCVVRVLAWFAIAVTATMRSDGRYSPLSFF
jgi:hypothetical protein